MDITVEENLNLVVSGSVKGGTQVNIGNSMVGRPFLNLGGERWLICSKFRT
jgi:hypothetical protein